MLPCMSGDALLISDAFQGASSWGFGKKLGAALIGIAFIAGVVWTGAPVVENAAGAITGSSTAPNASLHQVCTAHRPSDLYIDTAALQLRLQSRLTQSMTACTAVVTLRTPSHRALSPSRTPGDDCWRKHALPPSHHATAAMFCGVV